MQTPVALNELVAAEARAEMARQRKTAAGLAARLRSSDRTAYRLLSGHRNINLDQLEVIADFIGIDPSLLVSRAAAQGATAA